MAVLWSMTALNTKEPGIAGLFGAGLRAAQSIAGTLTTPASIAARWASVRGSRRLK